MDEQKNQIPDFEAVIVEKMRELIAYRRNTWNWVALPHTIKDTEKRQKELQIISEEVSKLAVELVEQKEDMHVPGGLVDSNFRAIELVRGYERDIQECLNRDWEAKKKAASDSKIDYIKNLTFLFGLPIGFVASVKNGVGNGHVDPNEAMVLGFAISIPAVFHKLIRSAVSKAAKEICAAPITLRSVPASIRNDIRVLYVEEIVKEKTNSAYVRYATVAMSINDNVAAKRSRMKAGIGRLFGRNGPR